MPSISKADWDALTEQLNTLQENLRISTEQNYKQSVRNDGFGKILTAVRMVANGRPIPRSAESGSNYYGSGTTLGESSFDVGPMQGLVTPHKPTIEEQVFRENKLLHDEIAGLKSRLASIFTLLDYYDSQQ
jgi:hypothetical protein